MLSIHVSWASLIVQLVKNLPAMQETGFDPWRRKIPWKEKWQPTPVSLPGEAHGQRSLADYSPWGCNSQTRHSDCTIHCHVSNIKQGPPTLNSYNS